MDPLFFAEHLCMYEQRQYSKIRPQECMSWVKSQTGVAVKNLVAFRTFHDKLGGWVKLSILNVEGLGKRAETIDFWIKVAEVSSIQTQKRRRVDLLTLRFLCVF